MATIQGQLNTPRESTFKTTEQTQRNIADVLAEELSGIAQAIADGGSTDYDELTHKPQINSVTLTGDKSADDLSLAMQEDLTSIKAIGTTNATGATISKGTYFYLNGTLCQAKVDIAVNATFTLNTNYEEVTAGGLNSLNSAKVDKTWNTIISTSTSGTVQTIPDISQYTEFLIIPWAVNSNNPYNPFMVDKTNLVYYSVYQDTTHFSAGSVEFPSNTTFKFVRGTLGSGWGTFGVTVKAR